MYNYIMLYNVIYICVCTHCTYHGDCGIRNCSGFILIVSYIHHRFEATSDIVNKLSVSTSEIYPLVV